MLSYQHPGYRLRPLLVLTATVLSLAVLIGLSSGELRGGDDLVETGQPQQQQQWLSPTFDDSSVILGTQLYECVNEPSLNAVAACNDNQELSRPDLTYPAEIINTGNSETFSIVLTAQARRVNLFSLHYTSSVPNLALSPTLQLPSEYNPNVTEVWTFNGGTPGPTIRAKVGDILEIQLRNLLPVSTGLFIPGVFNAREPLEGGFVRPGQTRIFKIPLSMHGTFQYHSAVDAQRQVAMGLFGALVVTDDTIKQDDQVLMISDSLVDPKSWQIYPPLRSPIKRAEEQYNGRIGNIILVNGESISSGPQLSMTSGTQHRLRFLNVCNARMLKITIPSLQFKVETQWTGVELFEDNLDAAVQSSFLLSPGSTADILIDIVDEMSGHLYEVLATEIIPTTERRRGQLKKNSAELSSAQPVGPIVSETWTAVGPAMKGRVVELLLLPSNDGVVSPDGFVDSLDLAKVPISNQLSDVVAQVSSCSDSMKCSQPTWGFKTSAFAPPDAELVDSSLLFEVICPYDLQIPKIDVKLFGIIPEQLIDTTFHVPNGATVFTQNETRDVPLAHSVIACTEGRVETPVDLRNVHLNRFIQQAMQGTGLDGKESLAWVRAQIVYELPEGANNQQISVATRAGTELPPPTLRLVYKTFDQNAGQLSQFHSTRPQDVKARRRRLERVFHEMQNEQQDMRIQLQTLYDQVKRKQQRQRLAATSNGSSNVVNGGNGRRLQQEHQQEDLVKELQEHLRQQEEQREVERKLINLQKSELPLEYKQQLIKELQHQLQVHYLKQQIHQRQLRRKLNEMNEAANSTDAVAGGVIGAGGAFRGALANQGALSFTEARALKQEKILYMKLYKHYNDLVGQMKHLKAASDSLSFDLSSTPGDGILPDQDQQHHPVQFYQLVPTLHNDPLNHQLPQRILQVKVVQGLAALASDSPPSKHRHLMASDIRRVRVAGANTTTQEIWADTINNKPIPSVTLTLGQSLEADFSGRVPMWVGTRATFPEECPTDLTPGTLIVWEVVNQTPMTHTLYFHRVLLEIFERQVITPSGDATTQRVQNSNYNNNNGHFIGVTIPAMNSSDRSYTVIRGVSKVPRLTAGIKARELHRWDVRVQSTILEHISNGMTTRLHFNVVPVQEVESKGAPSGIDFSSMDTYDDDLEEGSSTLHLVGAAAFGGSIVVAAIASLRYYRNAGRPVFHPKRRGSGHADELVDNGYAVSQALEMTPTSSLDAGTPIDANSFGPSPGGSIDHRRSDGMNSHNAYRLPYPHPTSPEGSPEGVPQSYLQSPERYRRIKHRGGVATPGSTLSSFNQHKTMSSAVATPHHHSSIAPAPYLE